MPKAASLEDFNVKKPVTVIEGIESRSAARAGKTATTATTATTGTKLITKGFRVMPEAAHQFEMLRAELGREHPKDMGPKLIAEALNLLFKKHGKPQIA